MPATATQHLNLLQRKAQLLYSGKSAQIGLSSIALNSESTLQEILASELPQENGYARVLGTIPANAGSYDLTTKELSLPPLNATFTATGGFLQWLSCFVLIDDSVATIINEDAPVQLLDGQPYNYQIMIRERIA